MQGVGFRPFVHRLARAPRAGGLGAQRGGRRCEIEVEGAPRAIWSSSRARCGAEAPPLARIERGAGRGRSTPRGLERLRDPARAATSPARHAAGARRRGDVRRLRGGALRSGATAAIGYPFITCTDCGPRFTVIEALPTTASAPRMRAFTPVRRVRARVRDAGRPALPLRDQQLSGVRPAAVGRARGEAPPEPAPAMSAISALAAAGSWLVPARSSRSGAWAASTSPWTPPTRPRCSGCANGSDARRSRSR